MTSLQPLPTSLDALVDEALDSYASRLASVNAISPGDFTRLLAKHCGHPIRVTRDSPVGTSPAHDLIDALSRLSGLPADMIERMTLRRYSPTGSAGPGTLLPWRPRIGAPVCPVCIADHPQLQLVWRVPHLPVCLRHGLALVDHCPRCGRGIRTDVGRIITADTTTCDNQIKVEHGRRLRCGQPFAELTTTTIDAAPFRILQEAMTDPRDLTMVGECVAADAYLSEMTALVLLLCHLAHARVATSAQWAARFCDLSAQRKDGTVKIGTAAPSTPPVRACIISAATRILDEPDIQSAADRLAAHYEHPVPPAAGGAQAWLFSHSRRTDFLRTLITASLAPRRSISYQLRRRLPTDRPPESIPQTIPHELYLELFADQFSASETVGRAYIALCLAACQPGVSSWAAAGELLDIPRAVAKRTALSASPSHTASPEQLLVRLRELDGLLDRTTNYRERERRVALLTASTDEWYEPWRIANHLTSRPRNGMPSALEWHWQQWALARPYTQEWSASWNRYVRTHYRTWIDEKTIVTVFDLTLISSGKRRTRSAQRRTPQNEPGCNTGLSG